MAMVVMPMASAMLTVGVAVVAGMAVEVVVEVTVNVAFDWVVVAVDWVKVVVDWVKEAVVVMTMSRAMPTRGVAVAGTVVEVAEQVTVKVSVGWVKVGVAVMTMAREMQVVRVVRLAVRVTMAGVAREVAVITLGVAVLAVGVGVAVVVAVAVMTTAVAKSLFFWILSRNRTYPSYCLRRVFTFSTTSNTHPAPCSSTT